MNWVEQTLKSSEWLAFQLLQLSIHGSKRARCAGLKSYSVVVDREKLSFSIILFFLKIQSGRSVNFPVFATSHYEFQDIPWGVLISRFHKLYRHSSFLQPHGPTLVVECCGLTGRKWKGPLRGRWSWLHERRKEEARLSYSRAAGEYQAMASVFLKLYFNIILWEMNPQAKRNKLIKCRMHLFPFPKPLFFPPRSLEP